MNSKFIRETSLTLFDDVLVHCSIGEYSQVNFDSEYCLSIRKKYMPKTLTMVHVHPDGCLKMSESGAVNDRNMVQGWSMAFGIPIIFVIISKRTIFHYGRVEQKHLWAFTKYVVKLENNRPVIYETLSFTDYDGDVIAGVLKLLAFSSRDSLFNNFFYKMLKTKIGKKIKISKLLL